MKLPGLTGHIYYEYSRDIRKQPVTDAEIVGCLTMLRDRYKTARLPLDDTWTEAWSLYIGTPDAMEFNRQKVLTTMGDENQTLWHNRVNVGKTYSTIETILGYLQQALFPNDDWFSVEPVSSGYYELSRVIKEFVKYHLTNNQFTTHTTTFLRQFLITGTSTLALPWRYEAIPIRKKVRYEIPNGQFAWQEVTEERVIQDSPEFLVLDSFDVYFDPFGFDPNKCNMFRRIVKTKAEVTKCIETGYYKNITHEDVEGLNKIYNETPYKDQLRSFVGINQVSAQQMDIEVWEFWGDLELSGVTFKNIWATFIGQYLVRFDPNPYWDGRPFVTSTYIPWLNTPYGLSAIQPNMGLLHTSNVLVNSRLDGMNLTVDQMFEIVEDGLIDPEQDIRTQPGKGIKVRERGTINPIPLATTNFMASHNETQQTDQTVNTNFGLGAVLGNQPTRSGERVTAQEIIALQDAGGNRLALVYDRVNATYLVITLKRVYAYMQQFVSEKIVVPVKDEPDKILYYWVGQEQLQYQFNFYPVGSKLVIGKEKFLKDLAIVMQFIQAVPEVKPQINFEALLEEMFTYLSFKNPSVLVKKPQQEAPPQMDMNNLLANPPDQLANMMGGASMQQALLNMQQTDPQGLTTQLAGDTNPVLPQPPPTSEIL